MTELVVCGLNYHSVPVAIRERFTIPQSCLKHALEGLKHFPHVKEAVVLSTCNRTEVYALVTDVQAGWREIDAFFASAQSVEDHGVLKPNFRLLREDVALHLFRVASGLDSMIIGESQIMSQVKTAHQEALASGAAGPILDSLFKLALQCGKRVRSETTMGKRAVSTSSAAVELGKNLLGGLKAKSILVVGAGKMGQICLKLLLSESNAADVHVANRSAERVSAFLKNNVRNLDRLKIVENFSDRHLAAAQADLVIVCSSAPEYVLTLADLEKARGKTKRPLQIIDIAVPRNVDPRIAELEAVKLYDSDHLAKIVAHNRSEREMLVAEAESIVFEMLQEFKNWQRTLLVVPTIAELREKIEAIRLEQMEKSCHAKSFMEGIEARRELEEISRAIVNQILHHPTTQLKATNDYEILRQQAEALRTLFDLNPLAPNAVSRQRLKRKSNLVNN